MLLDVSNAAIVQRRFYKLGRRSYSSPLEEKLNGLTSTIFLCYEIFFECDVPFLLFLLFLFYLDVTCLSTNRAF